MGMSSAVLAAQTVQAGTQLFLAPRLAAQFTSVSPMSATAVPQTYISAGGAQYIQATDAGTATGATNILYPFTPYLQSMLDYSTAGLERSAAGNCCSQYLLFICQIVMMKIQLQFMTTENYILLCSH